MKCVKDEPCHRGTLNCCFTCEERCMTANDCNDEDCEHHPANKEE